MDVNKFMEQNLANQQAIITKLGALIEAVAELGKIQPVMTTVVHSAESAGSESTTTATDAGSTVSSDAPVDPKPSSAKDAEQPSTSSSGSEPASESTPQDAPSKPTESKDQEEKPKTADDVRKALKAFAAIEGNAAALEILKSHGADSVSALMEMGQDVVNSVIQSASV